MTGQQTKARVSIVIPACNEAKVLARCLESISQQDLGNDFVNVVVVANGCTDGTASIARSFATKLPMLRVVELPASGKADALNAGDEFATAFPRVYLDADVEISPDALSSLVRTLDVAEARVAAPQIVFDLEGADAVVRAFYRVTRELPYVNDGLVGLGLYGISQSGRERFGRFPDLIADDLFVQRCFRAHERLTCQGTFTVRVPRDARSLLKVRRRVNQGNAQLSQVGNQAATSTERSSRSTMSALVRLAVTRPTMLLPVVTYIVLGLVSRRSHPESPWLRDDSSRR